MIILFFVRQGKGAIKCFCELKSWRVIMSGENYTAVFPMVVSPSNQAWTYMIAEDKGDGSKSLTPFGGSVDRGVKVSISADAILKKQSHGVFSSLSPHSTGGNLRYPVSSHTLKNEYLTQIAPCSLDDGRTARVHAVKVYAGENLGQDREDRFIKDYRQEKSKSSSTSSLRSEDMVRVEIDNIVTQFLNTTIGRGHHSLRAYGEDLRDMRIGTRMGLSSLSEDILGDRRVLLALSQTADELKAMNPCAPREEGARSRLFEG